MEHRGTTIIESLPVFPLPSTILFPRTVLPLHIFEPRYREMVSDVMDGDTNMAIGLIRPDSSNADEPELYNVAGAGTIIHAEKLEDGRYNILVQGKHRVRLLSELPKTCNYRRFRAEILPTPTQKEIDAAALQMARLQSCVLNLQNAVAETDAQLVEVLGATSDPLELADILAAAVISEPQIQQQLLATTELNQRFETLIDALAEVMVRHGSPPKEAMRN